MRQRAFTLIELLVVIALIGLLATIIIMNIWDQRVKAYDANIKSSMHQIRNAAELSYVRNGESYALLCDESDNTLSNSGELLLLENDIRKQNGNLAVSCYESADKKDYAASSPLRASAGKHWCIEGAGTGVEINAAITSASCQ